METKNTFGSNVNLLNLDQYFAAKTGDNKAYPPSAFFKNKMVTRHDSDYSINNIGSKFVYERKEKLASVPCAIDAEVKLNPKFRARFKAGFKAGFKASSDSDLQDKCKDTTPSSYSNTGTFRSLNSLKNPAFCIGEINNNEKETAAYGLASNNTKRGSVVIGKNANTTESNKIQFSSLVKNLLQHYTNSYESNDVTENSHSKKIVETFINFAQPTIDGQEKYISNKLFPIFAKALGWVNLNKNPSHIIGKTKKKYNFDKENGDKNYRNETAKRKTETIKKAFVCNILSTAEMYEWFCKPGQWGTALALTAEDYKNKILSDKKINSLLNNIASCEDEEKNSNTELMAKEILIAYFQVTLADSITDTFEFPEKGSESRSQKSSLKYQSEGIEKYTNLCPYFLSACLRFNLSVHIVEKIIEDSGINNIPSEHLNLDPESISNLECIIKIMDDLDNEVAEIIKEHQKSINQLPKKDDNIEVRTMNLKKATTIEIDSNNEYQQNISFKVKPFINIRKSLNNIIHTYNTKINQE